jgi:hypothetical protein
VRKSLAIALKGNAPAIGFAHSCQIRFLQLSNSFLIGRPCWKDGQDSPITLVLVSFSLHGFPNVPYNDA